MHGSLLQPDDDSLVHPKIGHLMCRLVAFGARESHVSSVPTISTPGSLADLLYHNSPPMGLEVPAKLDILIFQLPPPLGHQSPDD